MKKILPIVAVSFLSATCMYPVFASDVEDAKQVTDTTEMPVAQEATQGVKEADAAMQHMSRASKVIGVAVVSPKGESLGSVNDLVIDPETGQVVYAVVSYGSVMGLGGKLFGMPWKAMQWNQENHHYVVNVDQATLTNSPGFSFDADKWPSNLNELGEMAQRLVNP
jgi:sporulation protein YlmC with PRC-barrel domain